MNKSLLLFFILLTAFFSHTVTGQPTCNGKQILGQAEKINLDEKLVLEAKLDTGAAVSSLSATDIHAFKQNGKTWVRFSVYSPAEKNKFILVKPLIKYTRILKRQEENPLQENVSAKQYAIRAVVMFSICLGKQKKAILVNLVDRTHFQYPMLLGSASLQEFQAMVDVSQKYLTSPACMSSPVIRKP